MLKLPVIKPKSGSRIGLFGGSFDPPHIGHVKLAQEAMKRLNLQQVWWLVTMQNTLKNHAPEPQQKRADMIKSLIGRTPKMAIIIIKNDCITYVTLKNIKKLYPQVNFVWLMGIDSFTNIHKWDYWGQLMRNNHFVVFNRATYNNNTNTVAGTAFRKQMVRPQGIFTKHATWTKLLVPLPNISSTWLRQNRPI